MMVYDTEKYLLQPHIPGIVLSLYNTLHYNTCHRVYYVGVLDPTTNKMMVYDTEKYLLQPHIPGIVLSLYNTPHYNTCVRVYYVGVLDPITNKMMVYDLRNIYFSLTYQV